MNNEMELRRDVDQTGPRYTGVACRRCAAPVAQLRDNSEGAIQCPACGFNWVASPPVRIST